MPPATDGRRIDTELSEDHKDQEHVQYDIQGRPKKFCDPDIRLRFFQCPVQHLVDQTDQFSADYIQYDTDDNIEGKRADSGKKPLKKAL